ncbi:MAG: succinate dehydrogenase [Kiloniellaceae bacterium]
MIRPHRNHPLWWAFAVHRLSGVALALFLPLHFLLLGQALGGAAALDTALAWTEGGAVKAAEMGLVFLLAVHLFGGLRLLALEFLPWRHGQASLAALAGGGAFVAAFAFLFNAL